MEEIKLQSKNAVRILEKYKCKWKRCFLEVLLFLQVFVPILPVFLQHRRCITMQEFTECSRDGKRGSQSKSNETFRRKKICKNVFDSRVKE
jgi:hypothetical protein